MHVITMNGGGGSGWKQDFTNIPTDCKKSKGFDFAKCIERYTYATNETVPNINDSVTINYHFSGSYFGIVQIDSDDRSWRNYKSCVNNFPD